MSNSVDQMTARYKELQAKRTTLVEAKIKIEAELASRRRALKEALDKCVSLGVAPDELDNHIIKLKEVIAVKLDLFEADLKTAEAHLKPMIQEIQ